MNVIYYRKSLMDNAELQAAQKHFKCVNLLTDISPGDNVIYRYSLFPFPMDQENEILNIGAKPYNSYSQHRYVADLWNYVSHLGNLTPKTYINLFDLPENKPFVLKGETYSKKSNWNKSMFAENKKEAIRIHSELSNDGLIGNGKIYIREYVPLKTYLTGIGGMPISKEFRFFVAFGEIVSGGYYWQNYLEDLPETPDVNEVPIDFVKKVIDILSPHINMFVVDVAQTEAGDWIVIECNDFSQSGLSCNDPDILYSNLKKVLENGPISNSIKI